MNNLEFRATRKDTKETSDVLCIDWMHNCVFLGGHMCEIDLDDVIIQQFTGLTDVNGVKIFEGDKLKCLGYEGVVVYDSEEPRFAIKPDDCSDTFALIKYEMINFEVTGNIHWETK